MTIFLRNIYDFVNQKINFFINQYGIYFVLYLLSNKLCLTKKWRNKLWL